MQRPHRQRYGDRPDPDEPWRYACPECGSICVHANADNDRPAVGAGAYSCEKCFASFDEPIDRKKPPPRAGGSAIERTDG